MSVVHIHSVVSVNGTVCEKWHEGDRIVTRYYAEHVPLSQRCGWCYIFLELNPDETPLWILEDDK